MEVKHVIGYMKKSVNTFNSDHECKQQAKNSCASIALIIVELDFRAPLRVEKQAYWFN